MFSRKKKSFWGREKKSTEKVDDWPAVTVTEVSPPRPKSNRGHHSMSAMDDKQAHTMRHEAFAFMSNSPLTSADGFWTAKNSSRPSLDLNGRRAFSSPYAAIGRQTTDRPTHRRVFSASVTALPLRGENRPVTAMAILPKVPKRLANAGVAAPLPPPIPPKIPLSPDEQLTSPSNGEPFSEMGSRFHSPYSAPSASLPRRQTEPPVAQQTYGGAYAAPEPARLPNQRPARPSITALRAPEIRTGAINEARPALARSGYTFERPATIEAATRLAAASQVRSVTYTEGSVRAAFQDLELQQRSASWSSVPRPVFHEDAIPPEISPILRPSMSPRQALSSHPWRPHRVARRREWAVNELFHSIPGEVLGLIMHQLRSLHLASYSTSCATCWMRDCCSLMVANRGWSSFAKAALYEDIELVGEDSPAMNKRCKVKDGARLVLLRRTLKTNPLLASMVYSLKVPERPESITREDYDDLVASIIMCCPNLERLAGLYPTYRHRFSRLFYALATRQNLRAMNWIIEKGLHEPAVSSVDTFAPAVHGQLSETSLFHGEGQPQLQPEQSYAFFEMHVQWQELAVLNIHCKPGATLSPPRLLSDVLSRLPSLHTLRLSHLPASAFNDSTMLVMPRLRHLGISHCPGISSKGLAAFAGSGAGIQLMSLTLVHVKLDSLAVLGMMLSQMPRLRALNLVQSTPPRLSTSEPVLLYPYLVSKDLASLHWDLPQPTARASVADFILARSIAAGGFPALRTLRTPYDPEGIFQGLCKPLSRCDLPSDRMRKAKTILSQDAQDEWCLVEASDAPRGSQSRSLRHSYDAAGTGMRNTSDWTAASGQSKSSMIPSARPPAQTFQSIQDARPTNGASAVRKPLRHSKSESFDETRRFQLISQEITPPVPALPTGRFALRSPSSATLPTEGYAHQVQNQSNSSLDLSASESPNLNSNLRDSRLAAQSRLEDGRRGDPRFTINVLNERGKLVQSHVVGAFLGCVGSRIRYNLLPDADGGTDESGGLIGFREMLGDCGESLFERRAEEPVSDYGWDAGENAMERTGAKETALAMAQGNLRSAQSGYGLNAIFNVSTGQLPTITNVPIGEPNANKELRKRKTLVKRKSLAQNSRSEADWQRTRRPGCTGEWACRERELDGDILDKKGREKLSHVERGRWRDVVLS